MTIQHFTNEELRHEEWRRCQYPFVRYEVSNLGRVRHARRKNVLITQDNRNGYLGMRTRQGYLYPHKQVALAFCPGWKEGLQVNHKDGNKHNNRATNLETELWALTYTNAFAKAIVTTAMNPDTFHGECISASSRCRFSWIVLSIQPI